LFFQDTGWRCDVVGRQFSATDIDDDERVELQRTLSGLFIEHVGFQAGALEIRLSEGAVLVVEPVDAIDDALTVFKQGEPVISLNRARGLYREATSTT